MVKRARSLRLRKNRDKHGAYLVEGIRAVREACANEAPIEVLLVAPELLRSDPAWELVHRQAGRGLPCKQLSSGAFKALSERDQPTGLAAIVRSSLGQLNDLTSSHDAIFVALEGASGPGNLGTIVRTADSVGAAGVILVGATADPYDPAALRASMGSVFAVPLARAAGLEETLAWAGDRGLQLVTTSAHAEAEHWAQPYRLPLLLVLGSEARGLSARALGRGDLAVRIPMRGGASSLNLAVAAGILLYEIRRRTSTGGGQ